MSKKAYSRRDLLKYLGVGTFAAMSPMEIFLEELLVGVVQRASGASNLGSKYILVQQHGAPTRWMYDLFLKPYGGSIVPVIGVASEFEGGSSSYTKGVYKTYNVKGVQAPVMWTHKIANAQGGSRPMSDLMDNMLVLQGVDALNPGHDPASLLINRPLTSYSIDGVLADSQNLPFGSLSFGSRALDYRSSTGKSLKHYSSGDNFSQKLVDAFNSDLPNIQRKYASFIEKAVNRINERASRKKLGANSISVDQKSAQRLMKGELNNLSREYPKILKKYERVISETLAMSQNLKGISDKPVGTSGSRGAIYNFSTGNGGSSGRVKNKDLRGALSSAEIPNLAKQFAMTEYVILNNLTSSVSFNMDYLRNLNINGRSTYMTNDHHEWGVIPTVLYTTVYFRIASACILALSEALKSKPYNGSNMFNHTVIRQSGEFGREPDKDGSGSDHAPWASNCMLVSGMIKGPIIAGKILKDGKSIGKHPGSWGNAGPLENGSIANTGHVISTIAKMLGIPSPSPNNPSLIVKNSSGEVSLNQGYILKTKVV